MDCTCTEFGVNSSSHVPFRARTHTRTDATDQLIHASAIAPALAWLIAHSYRLRNDLSSL